jgi:hypothetical protein
VGKLAAAAANGSAVHTDAAHAAGLHHGAQGVAAGLNHLAAIGVAAGARDHHSIFGHLALAHAHGHVAGHHHHAIHHHAVADHATVHHFTEIL